MPGMVARENKPAAILGSLRRQLAPTLKRLIPHRPKHADDVISFEFFLQRREKPLVRKDVVCIIDKTYHMRTRLAQKLHPPRNTQLRKPPHSRVLTIPQMPRNRHGRQCIINIESAWHRNVNHPRPRGSMAHKAHAPKA